MNDLLAYSLHDGVASITMDDGQADVMSAAMLNELRAAFDRAESDGAIVILRSSREGVFSAGFDLKTFAARNPQRSFAIVRAGADLVSRLLRYPPPMIAAVEGHAYPMGAFLTLCCDCRISARGDHRIGLNEVAIGIAPPSFAIELSRSRLQSAWHNRTVTLGEMFEPEDALTAGFYDKLVEPGAADAAAKSIAESLKKIDRASHTKAKARLRACLIVRLEDAIDAEINLPAYEAAAR